MAEMVAGELKDGILAQLFELERQVRQSRGYPFDPGNLRFHLQEAIEGRLLKPAVPSLFRFVDTVDIPAVDRFEVDRIKIGEVDGVKVGCIDAFFMSCFGGLVEEAQAALTLRCNELTRTASCSATNEALGTGIEEATMSQVWALMKRQGKGQKKGSLQLGGMANLFRVRDAKGVLRFVFVSWYVGSCDWGVRACKVDSGHDWEVRRRVFSRNS